MIDHLVDTISTNRPDGIIEVLETLDRSYA